MNILELFVYSFSVLFSNGLRVCRFVWYLISTKRTDRDNHACPKEVGHW